MEPTQVWPLGLSQQVIRITMLGRSFDYLSGLTLDTGVAPCPWGSRRKVSPFWS